MIVLSGESPRLADTISFRPLSTSANIISFRSFLPNCFPFHTIYRIDKKNQHCQISISDSENTPLEQYFFMFLIYLMIDRLCWILLDLLHTIL